MVRFFLRNIAGRNSPVRYIGRVMYRNAKFLHPAGEGSRRALGRATWGIKPDDVVPPHRPLVHGTIRPEAAGSPGSRFLAASGGAWTHSTTNLSKRIWPRPHQIGTRFTGTDQL